MAKPIKISGKTSNVLFNTENPVALKKEIRCTKKTDTRDLVELDMKKRLI
jgi:hypothetical protein